MFLFRVVVFVGVVCCCLCRVFLFVLRVFFFAACVFLVKEEIFLSYKFFRGAKIFRRFFSEDGFFSKE